MSIKKGKDGINIIKIHYRDRVIDKYGNIVYDIYYLIKWADE